MTFWKLIELLVVVILGVLAAELLLSGALKAKAELVKLVQAVILLAAIAYIVTRWPF